MSVSDRPTSAHRVIRASAGTGKTYGLATWYLRLLHHGAAPDSILATTFTRKAAGEILERIVQRLANAVLEPCDVKKLARDLEDPSLNDKHCERMLTLLCQQLHRVAISTIDSFFNRVGTSFRHELGIAPDVKIVADTDLLANNLRRQAIDAMLNDDPHTLPELLRQLHQDDAPSGVSESLEKLFAGDLYEAYRQNPDLIAWTSLAIPTGLLSPIPLAEAISQLELMEPALAKKKNDEPVKSWATAWGNSIKAIYSRDWADFLGTGIVKKILDNEPTYDKREIPSPWQNVYQPLIEHAKADLLARVAQQTIATHGLLRRFDEHFLRLRREHGVLLYSDIPWLLSQHPPGLDDLYYRLDARVQHLLLDEFQDTSLQQWGVLRPFAQEVCSHSDGARTFYCVGDVKQAIYGWRGGCAELFDQIERELHLPPESHESQNASYRSSPVVLGVVNQVFSTLAGNDALAKHHEHAASWQDRFQEHTAVHTDRPGYVELITSPAAENDIDDDLDDDPETAAPTGHDEYVVQRIAQIHAESPGKTIGVLVAKNDTATTLIDLLRQAGLPASGEGKGPLTGDPAVMVMLAALTMADHPGNSVAAFQVLHSSLASVIGLKSLDEDQARHTALKTRQSLLDKGYAGVLTAWAKAIAPSCDTRSIERVQQLIELGQRYDDAATLRPSDFVKFVESTKVEDPTPAAIRVMTIHSAKGLEFDAVVLPELGQDLLKIKPLFYIDRESPTGPVRGIYRQPPDVVRKLSPQLEAAHQQWERQQLNDDLSKLYVAMTRARHALHMIVEPITHIKGKKPGADGWTTPSFAAILRRSLSTVQDNEDPAGGQTLFASGNTDWAKAVQEDRQPLAAKLDESAPLRIRFAPQNKGGKPAASRSWKQVTPSSLGAAGRVGIGNLLAIEPRGSLDRGSLMHAWFQQIDWFTADAPPPPVADETLLTIGKKLFPLAGEAWLRRQMNDFKRALTQPAVAEAFSKPTAGGVDLWHEREFAVQIEGHMLRGRFDRVVIYREGDTATCAELIDFKTDRITPDRCQEAADQYRPQLTAYRNALSQILALPAGKIRASLLFVEPGVRIEISA